jgi:penicillin-binding protein 1A
MNSIMRDVVRVGTAARAMKLGRNDLAGKTGTTNDFIDAWFCGFNSSLVAVAWIGFDTPHTLGRNETGGRTALPIWMGYMGAVLGGVPEEALVPPSGVVTLRVNPDTGLPASDSEPGVVDFFYHEALPTASAAVEGGGAGTTSEEVRNQLF